ERQGTRSDAVEALQRSEKGGVSRDPGLGGAGRHEDADSQTPHEAEPGSKGVRNVGRAMITDGEVAASQTRGHRAPPQPPECSRRVASSELHDELAGREWAEEHEEEGSGGP